MEDDLETSKYTENKPEVKKLDDISIIGNENENSLNISCMMNYVNENVGRLCQKKNIEYQGKEIKKKKLA